MKDKNGKKLYIGAHVTYAYASNCCNATYASSKQLSSSMTYANNKECLGTVTGINVSNDTVCVMSLSEDNDTCYELTLAGNELTIV